MALNDSLIRFVVHSSADDPRSRTVYRPRSEQLVEYLAHVSETRDEHQDDGERDTPRQRTEEEKTEDQRRYIEQRLKEIAAFEQRYGIKGRR